MPRPEYYSLRVPAGTTERIRRLADAMGISVAEWVRRAIRHYANGDGVVSVSGVKSETMAIYDAHRLGWSQGVIRFAIAAGLTEAERRAPTPPVIDQAEKRAARGAVIVDAMECDQ